MKLWKPMGSALFLVLVATEAGAVLFPPCRPPIDGAPAEQLSVQVIVPTQSLQEQRFGTAIADAFSERGLSSDVVFSSDPNTVLGTVSPNYDLNIVIAPSGTADAIWSDIEPNTNGNSMVVEYSSNLADQFFHTANGQENNFYVQIQRPEGIKNIAGDYLRGYLVGDSVAGVMSGEQITDEMFIDKYQALDGFSVGVQNE
ncbi:MAG: hypothetical protein ABJ360_03525 [Roseobacter sp.]